MRVSSTQLISTGKGIQIIYILQFCRCEYLIYLLLRKLNFGDYDK